MRALVGRELRDLGSEQLDLPGVWPHVTADLIEQGSLAGAVGADDQAAFARPYRQRYVLGHHQPAERLFEVDHFKSVSLSVLARLIGLQPSHSLMCGSSEKKGVLQ